MKNIRKLSAIVLSSIIAFSFVFYFATFEYNTHTLIYFLPGVSALLSFVLFIVILYLNKRIIKLKEEVEIQQKTDFLDNRGEIEDELDLKPEIKAENLINYNAIIERIYEAVSNDKNEQKYFESLLASISKELDSVQAVAYVLDEKEELFKLVGKYAYYSENEIKSIKIGEGVSGQVIKDQKMLIMSNVPDNYIQVVSGLGNSTPKYLLLYPIVSEEKTIALIEIASFEKFIQNTELIFEKLSEKILPEIIKFIK